MKRIYPVSVPRYIERHHGTLIREHQTPFASGGMSSHETVHRIDGGRVLIDMQDNNGRRQYLATQEEFARI